jgi:hypothetical protein
MSDAPNQNTTRYLGVSVRLFNAIPYMSLRDMSLRASTGDARLIFHGPQSETIGRHQPGRSLAVLFRHPLAA